MLVYLFSSNLSNPSTGGGISSDLCRSNSLGTSHSRHGSESEWPAVFSKRLESVKSHSTGLETKSSCGLDCENSPSTGLVYKWGGMEMRAGYSLALRTCWNGFCLTIRLSIFCFLSLCVRLLDSESCFISPKYN